MDRSRVPEVDHWPNNLLELRVIGQQGFVRLSYSSSNGVAGHLGTEFRNCLSHRVVADMVKRNPVAARTFNSKRHQSITGTGKLPMQERQSPILFRRCTQFYADGAFHSAPSLDVLGSLNVALDRFGADITGSAHVVGGRPEAAAPESFFQFRELYKKLASRDSFQKFHGIGHSISRRNRHKQMEVVRLDLQRDNVPAMFGANISQHRFKGKRNITGQNRFPVLRAPHHMVCRLVNAIPAVDCFNHGHIVSCYATSVNY